MILSRPSLDSEGRISRFMRWYEGAAQRAEDQMRREEAARKIIRAFCRQARLTPKPPQARRYNQRRYPEALLQQVEAAMREGVSLVEMSRRFGRSTTTCRSFVRAVLAKKSPVDGQDHTGLRTQ